MSSAANFVSSIPPNLQDTLLAYFSQLSNQYQNIKLALKSEDGQNIEPALIKSACFVAFDEDKKTTFFLVSPSEQLPEVKKLAKGELQAFVYLRELKAHSAFVKDRGNKDAYNALIGEAALQLLSGHRSDL
jgi:hypothetical protein